MKKTVTPLSLGTDKISSLLLRYSIPSIIAMLSTSIYNIADSIFIGQWLGPYAISGLALTMPIMNVATAFGVVVGIGASAIMSIRLGQGNRGSAEMTLGSVVLLNIIIATIFTIAALSNIDTILYFFGASKATISYARDYIQIILAGTIVTHLYYSLNEILRASGYPKKAMIIMLIAVVANIALNPIFIYLLGWGIKGAAVATVLSQTIALILSTIHFANPNSFIHFKRGIFRLKASIIGDILTIGLAPFLLHICSSVVVGIINKSLQSVGGEMSDIYIGAFGIINRVALVFILTIIGLNQGMQPIVGYNYGAKNYTRVISTLKITVVYGVIITTVGFLVTRIFPHQLALLFVSDSNNIETLQLIEAVKQTMKIAFMAFPFVGFQIVISSFFQYIGKPRRSIIMSLSRQVLFLIPMLLILPKYLGVNGVWLSMPIADFTATILAAIFIFFQIRKLKENPNKERVI